MNTVAQRRTWWIGGHVLLLCLLVPVLVGCRKPAPPTANAGADQVVNTGAAVTLDGSGSSDPNGDAITFSWKQTLGTAVSLSSTSASVVTFTAPANGTTLVFELTVSDGQSSSVGTTHVAVRPVEQSANVEEKLQHSVTEDPAVMGDFPDGWQVSTLDGPPPPPAESEIDEFRDQLANTHFAPVIEEDLAPGATRTLDLQLSGPSGVSGRARWIGTIDPLDVTIALDGSILATANPYHFGFNRGGAFLTAQATTSGHATFSVKNTSDVTVKLRLVFAATAQ